MVAAFAALAGFVCATFAFSASAKGPTSALAKGPREVTVLGPADQPTANVVPVTPPGR